MSKHKRGRGEGTIIQRENGTWYAVLTVGKKADGKPDRRTVSGQTKAEVQEKLAKLQGSRIDGTLCEATKMTVGEFLDRWVEDAARPTVRRATYVSYEGTIRIHLKPRIGHIPLAKLNAPQIQGMYSALERDGVKPRLRQLIHAVLRRALKIAVKWGLVPRNVCECVDAPRVPKKEIRPLTFEQVVALLEAAADDRLEALYVVAIAGGLRSGELFGMQWDDMEIKTGILSIMRTLQEVKGQHELTEPKTSKSRRRIALPQMAIDALLRHKARMLAEGQGGNPRVFCDTRGGWLRRSHFQSQWFRPLLKKAGLPQIRFHDLRHTAATLLLSKNVHPKIVQERLGHSTIGITLDTYSHVLPTMQTEAAEKLDEMFKQSEQPKKAAG